MPQKSDEKILVLFKGKIEQKSLQIIDTFKVIVTFFRSGKYSDGFCYLLVFC